MAAALAALGISEGPLTDSDNGPSGTANAPSRADAPAPSPEPGTAQGASGLPTSGPVVENVEVVSFGQVVYTGTIDLRPTIEGIRDGRVARRDTFSNREGLLPDESQGYYAEYVHPTEGDDGPGPQRLVLGEGGEIYYTADHYASFIEIVE